MVIISEDEHIFIPEGGITPEQEWNRDSKSLTFLDTNVVTEASATI